MQANHYPNLDLFEAPLQGSALIEASAGTGKTWTITGLYVRLVVEEGYRVEQILVVTFTKAATAELRERIRRRLAQALDSLSSGQPADDYCRALVWRVGQSGQRELALRRLQIAIRNFDESAIFTIHSFCQRVLTESAFESGMAFDAELTTDESAVVQEVVDDFWRRETANVSALWLAYLVDGKQTPDAWQQTVRPHLGKPYLTILPQSDIGGEGIVEQAFMQAFRQARMIWQSQRGDITSVLTDAASNGALNKNSYKPAKLPDWFEAFDLYFANPQPRLTLPEKLAMLTAPELAGKTNKARTTPVHPFFGVCATFTESAVRMSETYQRKLNGLMARLIGECNAELPKRKAEMSQMSFDDLLNRLSDALQAADGAHLAAVVRNRYRAALIDEFQDTDPIQYQIFRTIYPPEGQAVFLVGDPKQAIYAFRGADVFSYLAARRQAAAHYTLTVNQRSTPPLLAGINALFQRSPNPFLLSEIDYPPVQAADKARPLLTVADDSGAALRFTLLPPPEAKAITKENAVVMAREATATEIVRLLNLAVAGQARLVGDGIDRPINGGDIAVLVPTHRHARGIQDALARRKVKAVRQGQDNVFQTFEAIELERVLSAIAEPQRETRLSAALATELSGVDADTLHRWQAEGTEWERQIYRYIRYHELWFSHGFMPMFRHWLEEGDVIGRLLDYPDGERRLTNLLHLAELLQVASRDQAGPDGLLVWFARKLREPQGTEEALLRLESDAERVKIVTIHASKGLEYPIVFCPFLWDGQLFNKHETAVYYHDPDGQQPTLDLTGPKQSSHSELAHSERLAEKLRLLYVALTRAKQRCHIVWGWVASMETSALAWLLHGPAEPTAEPLAELKSRIVGLGYDGIEQALHELVGQAPGAVGIEDLQTGQTVYRPGAIATPDLQARHFSRPYLRQSWRMTSFSALSSGRHHEGPDYDPPAPAPEGTASAPSLLDFPRGAGSGRCLHAILEEWEFTSTEREPLETLVRRKLRSHAIAEDWTAVVADNLQATLAVALDGKGLRLNQIEARHRLAEMEFTYPLRHFTVQALQSLLTEPSLGLPPEFAQAARRLTFDTLNGYMKGFIDLVFQAQGQYYLLDWKSNFLGSEPVDYSPPKLRLAMASEHYYLQYLIYSLALHRYLGQRLPGYAYNTHFGGVYYLFLRGITQADTAENGVFFHRPDLGLIQALDRLIG